MLTNAKVVQIQSLLQSGLTQREVAAKADVSKGTVALIARGRRLPEPEEHPVEVEASPRVARCPTCGVRVELPCVACRTERYLARRRQMASLVTSRSVQGVHPVAGLVYARWSRTPRRRRRVA